MLQTQRYETSNFVYQAPKKHIRIASDKRLSDSRVQVASESMKDAFDKSLSNFRAI